jgi:hypothetical protein
MLKKSLTFLRQHWIALSIPIISLVYGIGDHNGAWDRVWGRTDLMRSVERLASGEGPTAFFRPNDPGFDRLWQFISSRTTNPDVVRRSTEHERPALITRLGGGERVIPTPPEFPKAIVVPRESPVLFVYDLTSSAGPRTEYAQVATLDDLDEWIRESRDTERTIVNVVLINILALALVISETKRNRRSKLHEI